METITPIQKLTLSDDLARRIKHFIIRQNYSVGQRLPTVADLAQRFVVGQPTVREALKKLETAGVVTIRHGSGIYVGEQVDHLFLPNPIISSEPPTKKMLLDLIDAKIPLESKAAADAVTNASALQIQILKDLLKKGKNNLANDDVMHEVNVAFHKELAIASGNYLLYQIINVLSNLYIEEQRFLIDRFMSKKSDFESHLEIFDAVERRDKKRASCLMQAHLTQFRQAVARWDKERLDLKVVGAYNS